jgi:hypothetical protein
MTAKAYEIWHGIVLTKILRSGKPVSLRMIETNPSENWSSYSLNGEVNLVVSYSTKYNTVSHGTKSKSWRFNFTPSQVRQLNNSLLPSWVALVCGTKSVDPDKVQVCLLDPSQINNTIDFTKDQPGITLRVPDGKEKIRVIKDRKEAYLVNKSRIDEWNVPGC